MGRLYQVFVDDNYYYMDEEARRKLGDFETFEEALAACRGIVDEFLGRVREKGVTADRLYETYTKFGQDPFIVGEPVPFRFSAWTYARERAEGMCPPVD